MLKYLLCNPVRPEELPTLKELTTYEICKVWSRASCYIHRQLLQKKAVEIGVGTFALVLVHVTVEEGKVLPVERPIFCLNKHLVKFYHLQCEETEIPDETITVQLNFEEIAADTHFRQEIVQECIHETLLCFAMALQDNKEVEFSFKGVGILAVRSKVVSMTFFDSCLLELDTTGNMLEALLGDSNMMGIVAFAGQNKFHRISPDEVITLPSFVVENPQQPSAPLISLKPRRDSAPWADGSRRASVLDPLLLARRRVSQVSQKSLESDQAKDKEAARGRFLPVIEEKAKEQVKQQTTESLSKLHPIYAPQPSGMGMHSPCTESEQRELWLRMSFRRQEVEAEVWRKYHAGRTTRSMELWTSCPYTSEDPCCPPHLRRKAYTEKLRQSTARQSMSAQQAELQLPHREFQDKGVQTEDCGESPGTASPTKKLQADP